MAREAWKQALKQMKLDWMKAEHPGFYEASGGASMALKTYSDNTANLLTNAICDFIRFKGGSATRVNTTGMVRKVNGIMKWTKGSTRAGTADLHCIYQGRHMSIEIKIGKDRVSEQQKKEKERIERAGGLYFIARNMPQFIEWFENIAKSKILN
jgi:hypothetical protein